MINLLFWFAKPAGRWTLVLLAFTLWTMFNRHDAARDAKELCEAETLRRQVQQQHQMLSDYERITELAQRRAEALRGTIDSLERDQNDLLSELQAYDCPMPDGLRERLRAIQ